MIKSTLKSLFVIICTLYILLLTPIAPFQTVQANTSGAYEYTVSGSNATITHYTGSGGNIVIPTTLDTYTVTGIGDYAFSSCISLTSVTIPNTITNIGSYVFSSCTSLISVTIPTSIATISKCAFYGCTSLTSLTIPANVTSIDDYAFYKCNKLVKITIPNTVKSIGAGAFWDCTSLIHVAIPNSITVINSYAFSNCTSLIDVAIPSSVTTIAYGAFSNCASLVSVAIPNSVTNIDSSVFYSCINLTEARFYGNAPATDGVNLFSGCDSNFKVLYLYGKTGFANPWYGYTTEPFYMITYQGNKNTSGIVPIDSTIYLNGSDPTTVLGNTGALAKQGFNFSGWNTNADGSGTNYAAGAALAIGSTNVTLYANYVDICDIDKDGTVSIIDLASLSRNYNARNTDTNWNSVFDFNKDGIVDLFDLVICSKRIN